MSEDINVTDGTVLECLNNKVDLDGRNYLGSGLEEIIKKTGGSGRNIGDIFYTSRLDNELNGAVEANGAIYSVEAFTGEQSVPELLRKGSLPSVSMAEYESIVSTNGSCRAWGWDNGDTFRVPTLKDVYLMAGQAESAGEFISESLPIPHHYHTFNIGNGENSAVNPDLGMPTGGTFNTNDAEGFSAPYSEGAKVRPDSVRYRAMVQISTGVREDAAQLKEYKLNNAHFFGESKWTDVEPKNSSWLVSNGVYHSGRTYVDYYKWLTDIKSGNKTVEGVSVKSVDNEYTDYDWIINTADETFRLPLVSGRVLVAKKEATTEDLTWYNLYSDGWLEQGGQATTGNAVTFSKSFKLSDYSISLTICQDSGYDNENIQVQNKEPETFIPFMQGKTGRVVSWHACGYAEIPTEAEYTEVKGLYFYVGDTVQDASLINAGGVLSDVADSIKRSSATDRETVVGWGMPDYNAGVSIPFTTTMTTAGQQQTMPYDGEFSFSWLANNVTTTLHFVVNSVTIERRGNASMSTAVWNSVKIRVAKGDVVKIRTDNNVTYTAGALVSVLFPFKGVN